MIECEKKVILLREEYLTLLKLISPNSQSHINTNYYYDTENFDMNKKGITYRIREKNGIYKATIKTHNVGNRDHSLERSRNVFDENDISFFENSSLVLQGYLKTYRTVFFPCDGIVVTLDENTYLDTVDYELEIEYLPDVEFMIKNILYFFAEKLHFSAAKTDIEDFFARSKTSKSKSHRFFERKNLIN